MNTFIKSRLLRGSGLRRESARRPADRRRLDSDLNLIRVLRNSMRGTGGGGGGGGGSGGGGVGACC